MKNHINSIICIASLISLGALLIGCSDSNSNEYIMGPDTGAYYRANYIDEYVFPDTIKVDLWGGESFFLVFDGKTTGGRASAEFLVLAEKYNDLSYNRTDFSASALYDGVCGMSLESLDYFDEDHPEGSDVSELFNAQFVTFYDFVTSGYTDAVEDKDYERYIHFGKYASACDLEGPKWFEYNLTEVNYDNTLLMSPEVIIVFLAKPEAAGVHRFRFTLTMPEITLSTEFEYEF